MSEPEFIPLRDEAAEATVFACPLCGCRFTHGGQACGSCPLTRGCELVQCPNCLYSFPRSSRIVNWMRLWSRLLRSRHEPRSRPG
jgi:hypothetical protein